MEVLGQRGGGSGGGGGGWVNTSYSFCWKKFQPFENFNLDKETESLKQVKKLLDAYPLELEKEEMNDINVETVLKYKNYI